MILKEILPIYKKENLKLLKDNLLMLVELNQKDNLQKKHLNRQEENHNFPLLKKNNSIQITKNLNLLNNKNLQFVEYLQDNHNILNLA